MNPRNAKGQFEKKSAGANGKGPETIAPIAKPQVSPPRDTSVNAAQSSGNRKVTGKSKALRVAGVMALTCISGVVIACLGLGDPWKTTGKVTAIVCGIASLLALRLAASACDRCGALMPDSTDVVIDRRTREETGYKSEVVATHYDEEGKYAGNSCRTVPYTYRVAEVKKRADYHCKSCDHKWSKTGSWEVA